MSRWFRFYDEALNDPKVQRLPGEKFKLWVNLLCLASKNEGVLPSLADAAFALRLPEYELSAALDEFLHLQLVDGTETQNAPMSYAPHNWNKRQYKSDVTDPTAPKRQKAYRDRNAERNATVTVTATRTDTEQKQKEPSSAKRPSGNIEFLELKRVYPKRLGNYGWKAAEKKFDALVKSGVNPKSITLAATRLGVTLHSKIGTEFIPMPASWLNSEDFTETVAFVPPDTMFLAKFGSAELDAWDSYTRQKNGKSLPRDRDGNWRVPAPWPPGYSPPEKPTERPPAPALRAMQ